MNYNYLFTSGQNAAYVWCNNGCIGNVSDYFDVVLGLGYI